MTLTAAEIVRILHDHVKAMHPGQLVSEPVLGYEMTGMDDPPTSTIYATFEVMTQPFGIPQDVATRKFNAIKEMVQRIP